MELSRYYSRIPLLMLCGIGLGVLFSLFVVFIAV